VRVLVTGGAGFIGSHAVDALVDQGADVLVVDSLDPGVYTFPPDYLNEKADYCFADLRAWQPDDRCNDVEVVLHYAALGGVGRAGTEPENVITSNVGGTARLLSSMHRWGRLRMVILASSFSVYGSSYRYRCATCGETRGGERGEADLAAGRYEVYCLRCGGVATVLPLDETAVPNPLEVYGSSKYMQELCFRGFQQAPVHILRQSSVYGTRLRLDDGEATIIAKIAGWISSGAPIRLFEDGGQIRDWVHVDDSVAAALALIERAAGPPVVNVCTGAATTLLEACEATGEAMDRVADVEVVGGHRSGDMRHCLGDPAVLTELIGRAPISFRSGAKGAFSCSPNGFEAPGEGRQ